jgi:hypothetical protein
MSTYTVQSGDSPYLIAHKLGVSFDALIAANPHKETAVVSGVRTWRTLSPNESIVVPDVVYATAKAALDAMKADPNYCHSVHQPGSPVNVAVHAFKHAWNRANPGRPIPVGTSNYEVTVAAAIASELNTEAPSGCEGHHHSYTESTDHGVGADSSDTAVSALTSIASTAASALSADPNYCQSVGRPGSPVNAAVHAFKLAWNSANPSSKLPVGTGNYEQVVADAIASIMGQGIAPAGCGHAAPAPHVVPQAPAPPAANVTINMPPAPAPITPPAPPPVVIAPAPQPDLRIPEQITAMSTGSKVAVGIGIAALVGVVAIATSSKKMVRYDDVEERRR